MNKFKTRKDIPAIAKMLGKIKNPSEGTVANLQDISQVLAGEEKSQAESTGDQGGVFVSTEKPKEIELSEEQKERIKDKRAKIKELKAVKDGDTDMSINTETTTDVDLGNTMVAKIFGKRKARKKEEEEKPEIVFGASTSEKHEMDKFDKDMHSRMTVFDEPPPNYYGENDPPLSEPTL